LSAALVAVTAHVPLASVTESVVPKTEQPFETPELNVTAPVPLPPVLLNAEVDPYVTLEGVAKAVNAAWLALASVIVRCAEVAAL
jgi:hypothetical protein